ncbi:MAG: MBL fold metallo-hydrolase [Bacteroidetes bacterium]|nr:MBL fold metallo-hydrolase [Bacteroidota bacterium]
MLIIISILFVFILLLLVGFIFMQQSQFGKMASGAQMEAIQKSPNFKNGKFQNLNFTPDLTEGATYSSVLKEFILKRSKRITPKQELPTFKTNLFELAITENVLIWMGHSTYFLQVEGKRILVDPVLSGSASPIRATTRSFKGTDIYRAEDIPPIDYLFISHDHWDHLDHKTVVALKPKIKKIITGLGTGAHIKHWGFSEEIIYEKDWNETLLLEDGFEIQTCPARHFSGRGFVRNRAIWLSFVLKTPKRKLFLGGDSGYDTHFKSIGKQHGPFDLAILECGQYNKNWKYIHMMPEELLLAAEELKAQKLLPVHWAKFALAQHDWDEPIIRVKAEAMRQNFPLLHPRIGEIINFDEPHQTFDEWWKNIT